MGSVLRGLHGLYTQECSPLSHGHPVCFGFSQLWSQVLLLVLNSLTEALAP